MISQSIAIRFRYKLGQFLRTHTLKQLAVLQDCRFGVWADLEHFLDYFSKHDISVNCCPFSLQIESIYPNVHKEQFAASCDCRFGVWADLEHSVHFFQSMLFQSISVRFR